MSGIQGGGFYAGFAAGALSSMASSLYQGVGYDNPGWHGLGGCGGTNNTGMIIFGTVMGGSGAALTGGNFWQGAVTGLTVSWLNDAMHNEVNKIEKRNAFAKRFNKIDPYGRPIKSDNFLQELIDDVKQLRHDYKVGKSPKIVITNTSKVGTLAEYVDSSTENIAEQRHTVRIYDNSFAKDATNYELASTLFHEFYHAWQYTFQGGYWIGYAVKNYSGNMGYKTPSFEYIESQAYLREVILGNRSRISDYNERASKLGLTLLR